LAFSPQEDFAFVSPQEDFLLEEQHDFAVFLPSTITSKFLACHPFIPPSRP